MIIVLAVILFVVIMYIMCKTNTAWGMLVLVIMVVGLTMIQLAQCDTPNFTKTNLYAGYNGLNTFGRFFLGSEEISENDVVYYWINQDGVKSKHNQPMSDSIFIEDGGNYMIEKSYSCPKDMGWFFINPNTYKESSFEFHVPENSIVSMYEYK
jgi:hypothetical protein